MCTLRCSSQESEVSSVTESARALVKALTRWHTSEAPQGYHGDGFHPITVSLKGALLLPGIEVPHLDGLVVTTADNVLPIGGHSDSSVFWMFPSRVPTVSAPEPKLGRVLKDPPAQPMLGEPTRQGTRACVGTHRVPVHPG